MKNVFKFLKSYSTEPVIVDRIIVSAFIDINKLSTKLNKFLKGYYITSKQEKEFESLQDFIKIIGADCAKFEIEELIEVFEFVVSPSDRVINGAIYTPNIIREYIIEQCFSQITNFNEIRICDPACGCSGFLYTAAKKVKKKTGKKYSEIFSQHLFGLDIQEYSITRSRLLLTLFALIEGEEPCEFKFNLFQGNALEFEWRHRIKGFSGFQVIVGNPPYVCSRNMDEITLGLLGNWSVTKSGHPDLYIPFFQIGYENLGEGGILGLITVNTFLKSINGRALRNYLAEEGVKLKIINFGGEQIFKDKNTYTCLCFLQKKRGNILYARTQSSELEKINSSSFFLYRYEDLNHHDGWNLVNSMDSSDFVNSVEAVGTPFKDLFVTRNGIATLKNDIYKFTPYDEDSEYYYISNSGIDYAIERGICRSIVNANKIRTEKDLNTRRELIIFPYISKGGIVTILKENEFKENYPSAYRYLKAHRPQLDQRDKGNVDGYEKWYAYGRRQSMDICAYKLFFPHICERPRFVISKEKDLLFYNGIAVVSNSIKELELLKSLLESDVFFDYIRSTTKDYSSGYISLSRNYIKNFGVLELTKEEKVVLGSPETDPNIFWRNKYNREIKMLRKQLNTLEAI